MGDCGPVTRSLDAYEPGPLVLGCLSQLDAPYDRSVLMEGLIPIQEGLRDWLKSHTKDRQIYIGMDPALGTGHPTVLATHHVDGARVTVLLALVLPGNKVLAHGRPGRYWSSHCSS